MWGRERVGAGGKPRGVCQEGEKDCWVPSAERQSSIVKERAGLPHTCIRARRSAEFDGSSAPTGAGWFCFILFPLVVTSGYIPPPAIGADWGSAFGEDQKWSGTGGQWLVVEEEGCCCK